MNAVERASRDMLVALIMEANRQSGSILDLNELRTKFNLKISDALLPSSIDDWESRDYLIISRTFDGTGAGIRPNKYGAALSSLLEILNADHFEVNWQKEEILTDVDVWADFPSPNGWKLLLIEKEQTASSEIIPSNDDLRTAPNELHRIDSTQWTGAQFTIVDTKVLREVRDGTQRLKLAVYGINFQNDAECADLKGLVDALEAVVQMAEPEIGIIQRILASPKFKTYSSLFGFVATIRGAIGL